jgi:hypothetical protein
MSKFETPTEIDAEIYRLQFERAKVSSRIASYERYRDSEREYDRLRFPVEVWREVCAQRSVLNAQIDELQSKYTGWPRYWHVTNSNGHIHTSLHCSSCFYDTQYVWRTDLSGMTPQEVVDAEAHNACTVCMPIAPVEQRAARERFTQAQRAAKKAERETKADAKLLKAAERAQKQLAKIEVALEKLGGQDYLNSLPRTGPESAYAVLGEAQYPAEGKGFVQSSIADIILDDVKEHHGERRYGKDPREIIEQARERGLI